MSGVDPLAGVTVSQLPPRFVAAVTVKATDAPVLVMFNGFVVGPPPVGELNVRDVGVETRVGCVVVVPGVN